MPTRSSVMTDLARGVVGVLGAVLAMCGLFMAANEAFLHGFSPSCGDPDVAWARESCGITWLPGLPYVPVLVVGLGLVALALRSARAAALLVLGVGALAAVTAVLLLWTATFSPAPGAPSQPATPQVVLLLVGVALAGAGTWWARRS